MNWTVKAILLLMLFLYLTSCTSEEEDLGPEANYSVNIIEKIDLAIPSGSGITGYKGGFLTVGDDTPWLYYLDSLGTLTDSLRLSYTEGYVPGVRMASALKPDFECITRLNESIVLIMGSGSYNPGRDTAYLVNAAEHRILAKKTLAPLFRTFADLAKIEDRHTLNIEGVVVAKHEIYFFNRGDLSGKSIIFKADLSQFISYFTSEDTINVTGVYTPTPYSEEYGASTFSSCVYIPGSEVFIFTSTSEQGSRIDSAGNVVDGEIKGSFIGRIRFSELSQNRINAIPILENNELAPIKVEGIWMHKALSDSVINFIGVSDPDDGSTNTYMIQVKINRLR